MKIPVENIYYLLCYAWDKLDEKDLVSVSAQDCNDLLELLTRIFLNGTTYLLKKGLHHDYIAHSQVYAGVKGKLNFADSLHRQSFQQGRSICEFDEFSPDVLPNQILASTINKLLNVKELDRGLKDILVELRPRFTEVQAIAITEKTFQQVRLSRQNRYYGLLLNVCELLHLNLLLEEQTGSYLFNDFLQDEKQMAALFEAFVRNFYRHEQTDFQVSRENIMWQFDATDEALRYVPKMQTDISLKNKTHKIIIDTKYYYETLQTHFSTQKIRSEHLYQISSYLENQPSSDKSLEGILLYPVVNQSLSLRLPSPKGFKIRIETIDLTQPWVEIRNDLLIIIKL